MNTGSLDFLLYYLKYLNEKIFITLLMSRILRQNIVCITTSSTCRLKSKVLKISPRILASTKFKPDTCKIIPLVQFLHDKWGLCMDMFWNKRVSIFKFCIILVLEQVAFHTEISYNLCHHVAKKNLQSYLEHASPPTVSCVYNFYEHPKNFTTVILGINVGFIHNGILLL
jgi:hypothetical protein